MLKRLFLYAWTQDISKFQQGDISARKNEMLSINPGEECLPTDPCIRLIFLKRTLSHISAFLRPEPQQIRKH